LKKARPARIVGAFDVAFTGIFGLTAFARAREIAAARRIAGLRK
jgi:hypothetical protein